MDWERMMPDAWRVFFRNRSPRPIQVAAMPVLVRGISSLLSSPTASGKTEGVFAPLYQRHITFARPNLSVVYVAPTKALVNDMYERLLGYFGDTAPETIQRYTGDHHDFRDAAGKFALLCTPEALDSIQLLHPDRLLAVRALICDELHLLHGTARGQQLRSVISRIRSRCTPTKDARDAFQMAGMTATVKDQDAVSKLWLGQKSEVVSIGEQRPIDMSVVRTNGQDLASVLGAKLRTSGHRKVLLFANTRNQAHITAAALSTELDKDRWPVLLHIGILSRAERERIESLMRREPKALCVATSTLEVGIDIGDVDLVVLSNPPTSISGFLQRIGRGNRRSDKCVVWACAAGMEEEQLYEALLHCGVNGILDEAHEYDRPSVHFQQAVSLAWSGTRRGKPLTYQNLPALAGSSVREDVVRDMVASGILKDVRGALVPNDEWMDVGDLRQIHSVILGGVGLPLVDSRSGEVIGSADRMGGLSGQIYAGSHLTAIHAADRSGVYLAGSRRGSGGLAKLPGTRGRKRGLSRELVWALASLSGFDPTVWKNDSGRLITWGGWQYNKLLAAILILAGECSDLNVDSYAITGVNQDRRLTPAHALELAVKIFEQDRISSKVAAVFREGTPYISSLGRTLQNEESKNSVPKGGFIRWLQECIEIAIR